jgi:hypothetical protein
MLFRFYRSRYYRESWNIPINRRDLQMYLFLGTGFQTLQWAGIIFVPGIFKYFCVDLFLRHHSISAYKDSSKFFFSNFVYNSCSTFDSSLVILYMRLREPPVQWFHKEYRSIYSSSTPANNSTEGPRFFRSHPKNRPIQSPLTTHKGMWRIYSNPDPHGVAR